MPKEILGNPSICFLGNPRAKRATVLPARVFDIAILEKSLRNPMNPRTSFVPREPPLFGGATGGRLDSRQPLRTPPLWGGHGGASLPELSHGAAPFPLPGAPGTP